MGLFYNPPPPFMGGHQPHEPRRLAPSQIIVPNPPFWEPQKRPEWRTITATTASLLDWAPGYPYMGSEMPLQGRQLPSSQIIVPNPPFLEPQKRPEWMTITAVSLLTAVPDYPYLGNRQPLRGRQLAPSLILVPNPPFPGDSDVRLIYLERMLAEVPPSPAQVFYNRLVQEAATASGDNPPFGMPPPWLLAVLGQWQVSPPAVVQYAKLVQAAADNPPFGIDPWLWTILSQWQGTTPAVFQGQKVSPGIPGQSIDNPPARSLDLRSTFVSFLPGAAPAVLARNLSPAIPGQSIDTPPFTQRGSWLTLVKAWEPAITVPQPRIYYPQPLVITPDNPPFGMPPDWLYTVLAAGWQPGQPLPKQLQKLIQEGVVIPPTPDDWNIITIDKILHLKSII